MLTTEANYDQIVIELIWTRQKIKNNISLFYTAWYQQLLTNDKVERSVNTRNHTNSRGGANSKKWNKKDKKSEGYVTKEIF